MNKRVRGRSADTVFVLIVFSIFAFSVLLVLMLGAGVYRNVNDISREGQQEYTALSYIWTKTKNFDKDGSIYVSDFHGVPAIFIDETIGDTEFRTAIYYYDGWLYELFSDVSLEFYPENGMRIIGTEKMSIREVENGLIEVVSGDRTLLLTPRSGLYERGVAP